MFMWLLALGGVATIAYELRTGTYYSGGAGNWPTRAPHPVYFVIAICLHAVATAVVAYLAFRWTISG